MPGLKTPRKELLLFMCFVNTAYNDIFESTACCDPTSVYIAELDGHWMSVALKHQMEPMLSQTRSLLYSIKIWNSESMVTLFDHI